VTTFVAITNLQRKVDSDTETKIIEREKVKKNVSMRDKVVTK